MPKPSARGVDNHSCPLTTGSVPHVGGPITGPTEPTVLVEWRPMSHVQDFATCAGPIDRIVTGCGSVRVGTARHPVTRETDHTMHGGVVVPPCATKVFIDDNSSVGTTLGNPDAAAADCQAAAAGRNPPPGTTDPDGNPVPQQTTQQSYNNCGVETTRLMINRNNGSNVSQEQALNDAMDHGDAHRGPSLWESGGTGPGSRVNILERNGVQSSEVAQPSYESGGPQPVAMTQPVSEGRGVNHVVNSSILWNDSSTEEAAGDHVVNVNGVEYGPDGNVAAVIITDTGTGRCRQRVPIDRWRRATDTDPHWNMVVTDGPIYR